MCSDLGRSCWREGQGPECVDGPPNSACDFVLGNCFNCWIAFLQGFRLIQKSQPVALKNRVADAKLELHHSRSIICWNGIPHLGIEAYDIILAADGPATLEQMEAITQENKVKLLVFRPKTEEFFTLAIEK